jgi:hypothetical protein
MAFRIREFTTSRSGTKGKDSESREIIMIGDGSSSDAVAKAAFVTFAPAFFDGLVLQDIRYEPLGGLMWRATAIYLPDAAPDLPGVGIDGQPTPVDNLPGPNDPLGPSYDFDFTGVTEHITQSKETIHRIARDTANAANSAPDNQRAIGVTKDGRVEGCDRISPNLELIITRTFAFITQKYIDTVNKMVGSTNTDVWFNYPAKSVIFLGGTTQSKDSFKKTCTFKFLPRPNLTDIAICDGLTIPAKKGSEYLWVSYKGAKDGKLIMQPDGAYVERIVDSVNFADLRIGI